MTQKSDITVKPGYYDYYLGIIPEEDVMDALYASLKAIKELDLVLLQKIGLQVYAPGKWTVHDLLQHLIDTERIFSYRALAISRGERQALPSFDENEYLLHAHYESQDFTHVLTQYRHVRQATISLIESFNTIQANQLGNANGQSVSVRALSWMIAGHEKHHIQVIKERYLIQNP